MSRAWRAGMVALTAIGMGASAAAQDGGKLARLIPNLYGPAGLVVDSEAVLPNGQTHSAHFNSAFQAGFSQLNIALVSQIASVPLPSPEGGYTYHFDSESGVFVRSTQSFGPTLADRAETIGQGRVSVGFNFQRFHFDAIEGVDLTGIPAVFTHDSPAAGGRDDVVTTLNAVDLTVRQLTAFLTYGLGSRVDVSAAVPIFSVDLGVTSDATIQRIGTAANPRIHFFRDAAGSVGNTRRYTGAGQASGVGDVHLRLKANTVTWGKASLALGVDLRLPTGDEENLLGSGALGLRPFLALSSVHRVSPHFNLGYQWNGDSVLAGNLATGQKAALPHQLVSAAGVDFSVGDRLTLAFDLLARRTFDSPRLQLVTFRALDNRSTFPDISFPRGSFNSLDGAAGFKWNPTGKLLVDANVVFKLNESGLRDQFVPMLGVQYTF
jgi:hypothetical protein